MSAWEKMLEEAADAMTEMVLARLRGEMTAFQKHSFQYCYSEEETAEILKISVKTLRRERDDGAISYSEYRGKTVFQPHHIFDYLARHEMKRRNASVTLKDVLATSNVIDFTKAA